LKHWSSWSYRTHSGPSSDALDGSLGANPQTFCDEELRRQEDAERETEESAMLPLLRGLPSVIGGTMAVPHKDGALRRPLRGSLQRSAERIQSRLSVSSWALHY
jgi:hypothetical protein